MTTILLICNLQNDYLEGGSYATEGSLELVLTINRIKEKFDHCIFIVDKHSPDHVSFKSNGGTRPPHCIEGTSGCEIHQDIDIDDSDHIVEKGSLTLHDSESGFYVASAIEKETSLTRIIEELKGNHIYICGMKYEYDIFSTALDAIKRRYKVSIVENATLGDDINKIHKVMKIMNNSGVKFVSITNR